MPLLHQPNGSAAHPATIRFLHWVWVYAIGCMVFSGLQIYNASPSLPFTFPGWSGLGDWLGAALAWQFSAMRLLAVTGMVYLAYGLISGHFQRDLGVPRPRAVGRDLWAALTFRLGHRLGHYNAVQRLLYIGVIAALLLQVITGLAIWKPVQLGALANLLGGISDRAKYSSGEHVPHRCFRDRSRRAGDIFPRTLVSMIVGIPA